MDGGLFVGSDRLFWFVDKSASRLISMLMILIKDDIGFLDDFGGFVSELLTISDHHQPVMNPY